MIGKAPAYRVPPDDGLPRYLAVRDPLDRFASLCRQVKLGGELKDLQRATPDQIMHAIETSQNRHWTPLSAHMVPDAIPVPLSLFFRVLGLENLQANPTPSGEEIVPPSRIRKRIRDFYAADFDLWERARAHYGKSPTSARMMRVG